MLTEYNSERGSPKRVVKCREYYNFRQIFDLKHAYKNNNSIILRLAFCFLTTKYDFDNGTIITVNYPVFLVDFHNYQDNYDSKIKKKLKKSKY